MEELEIINKVSNSGLITIDLETYYTHGSRVLYDLKQNLFMEAILKEKDFREFLKNHDWIQYKNKHVAVTCSVEAIIPAWAYMLLATKIQPYASTLVFGDLEDLETALFVKSISSINPASFKDAKVVVKGCGNLPVPQSAYFELTKLLTPYVSSIMYGEPCSTVPVYKRAKL